MAKKRHNIRKAHATPHFHFDVERWKTEDGYNADVKAILNRAFELPETHPDFTYVIGQALALRPYWEKHPEMHEKIFPIKEFKRPWDSAKKRADITDLRSHDLRHEFASQLIISGADSVTA